MVSTIIFDFDGTIADSGAVFIEALEEVLSRQTPFTDEEIARLRNSSPREVIKLLGIKKWQVPFVIAKGKKAVARKMHTVTMFDGIPEAIKELHAKGYTLYILSTNNTKEITDILKKYNIDGSITKIYSGTKVFGKAKRLKALFKEEQLNKDECVYIGDEIRDIEATKQVGVRCIAVGWGYCDPAALASYKPAALATKPTELGGLIHKL